MRKNLVWMINNAQELLGILLHAPRGPFYSPKATRSRLRAIREGNSCLLSAGAPDSPVHHRTLSGVDFLPYLAKPTIGSLGAVGAPDTVRCPLPTVGSATCLTQIAQPTVGPADRWLTGQSGAHRTVR